jgi:poly-beta-1,6-N-acetyl-D-glucosamine biosynthesis protein PgaD
MVYLYLLAAILAVLGVFVGLIIIIKGFVDKSNKNIKLGTIMVSIALIIALSGATCIAIRLNHFRKKHEYERRMKMEQCMKECDFDMMEGCAGMDSISGCDSNGVKVVTKVIMDKQCKMGGKKCEGKCKHDMH